MLKANLRRSILEWASSQSERTDHPAEEWSDFDFEIYTSAVSQLAARSVVSTRRTAGGRCG